MKVDIITHSIGGMIARYYLRHGTLDVTGDYDFPVDYHGEDHYRRTNNAFFQNNLLRFLSSREQ